MNASGPGEWITAATVRRCFSAMSRRILQSLVAETESRPDVGSSRKRIFGSATSSRPTLTRFRWPPEMPRSNSSPIIECWTCVRPSVQSTSMTFSRFISVVQFAGSRMLAENVMLSRTVSSRSMMSSCGTNAVRCLKRCRSSTSSPLTVMMPPVFLTLPVMRFMMVVLPAPDAPMMAVDLPHSSAPLGPRMTVAPPGSVSRRSENSMR
mmetsp:Transcript_13795/g.42741  ORF Transcript_13795/g.42741 Transcript_13795/m.42741 type:complete len:208 (+) Transcript_13795:1400-2023(+)